ncbi:dienelactone hydrolase family protein [Limnohabitans sp.]|uniref:dienelactone hydrolase family protein n=1 Tax=Limnohabitans sp. TaxID=1907725 RepID=UPI0037BE5C4C
MTPASKPLQVWRTLVLMGSAWLLSCSAQAQLSSSISTSTVDIPVVGEKCNERVQQVSSVTGQLQMPSSALPVSAVVILHSNAGIIGVGSFYAKALNAAGIATLEVDSFTPRGIQDARDRTAPVLCDRLQDAWGALLYLSKDTRIDASRIGITGFSSGGALTVMTGMGVRPRRLHRRDGPMPAHLVYAAHFAVYPSCANLMDDPVRIRAWINPGKPQNWGATQKRIHIVSGTQEDFDFDPRTDCLRMAQEFPDIAPYLSVRLIEGATHAFDWPTPPPPAFNPNAKAQTGGMVRMRYSEKDALETRQEMLDFFMAQLKKN